MSKNMIVGLAVVAVVLIIGFATYGSLNSIRDQGKDYETRLTAQYLDNQNYLSSYISGFYEQIGVANAASDKLDQILLDAVKGRYDDGGFGNGSPMFAAIAEAYPEAGVTELMNNWGKIQDYVAAGREGYRGQQKVLLDMLQMYDKWRVSGMIKSMVISAMGFPSNSLEARVGESVLTGEYARQKMYQIVLTKEAVNAYETGVMEPLQVP